MLCKRIDSFCVYIALLSSVLNGSSEISHFKRRDAIDGIMFVFYSGLPHMCKDRQKGLGDEVNLPCV